MELFICEKCKRECKNKKSLGAHQNFCLNDNIRKDMSERQKKKNEIRWAQNKGKSVEELYGEERGKEVREKLSVSHIGQISHKKGKKFEEYYGEDKGRELRDKLSETWSNKCKNMTDEEKREFLDRLVNAERTKNWRSEIDLTTGRLRGEEARMKSSETHKEAYRNGRQPYPYSGNTKWYDVDTSIGSFKVQGSYEVRMIKILEFWKQNNKIFNWEYTSDRMQYIDHQGKQRTYIIDFKIWSKEDEFYYLEVKGFQRMNDDLKWKAVRDKGYRLDVYFRKEIEKAEIDIKGYVV